jgi:hypothetical protein
MDSIHQVINTLKDKSTKFLRNLLSISLSKLPCKATIYNIINRKDILGKFIKKLRKHISKKLLYNTNIRIVIMDMTGLPKYI